MDAAKVQRLVSELLGELGVSGDEVKRLWQLQVI